MRLQEAADMLGVHYQTAYGWVRGGRLPARMVGGGYDIAETDVRAFSAERQLGRKPTSTIQVRDWPSQARRLFEAIVDGEETAARRVLDRLAGHVTITDLCDRVIAPALRHVGEGWQLGHVSIAQEHRATAICEHLIAAYSAQPAGRPRGTAVAATPQYERHAMPALMARCLPAGEPLARPSSWLRSPRTGNQRASRGGQREPGRAVHGNRRGCYASSRRRPTAARHRSGHRPSYRSRRRDFG